MNYRPIFIKFFIVLSIAFVFLLSISHEASALKTYGNRTETVTLSVATPKPLNLTANLTINDKINHTFQMDDGGTTATFTVEYTAGNRTGYLFKLVFDDRDVNNNVINFFSCDGTSQTELCTGGCGDFFDPTIFTVSFNPSKTEASSRHIPTYSLWSFLARGGTATAFKSSPPFRTSPKSFSRVWNDLFFTSCEARAK